MVARRMKAPDSAGSTPTVSVRCSSRRIESTACSSWRRPLKTRSISWYSRMPRAVRASLPRTRSNSVSPVSVSRCASSLLTAGCDTPSAMAAWLTVPCSTTALKASTCRRFRVSFMP
ncbi:Uncharacterised protein [Achromobacter sp. 2789STDY5608621]|nr:Uncharacterised protein [Achromobacter sp. 2789STDY5608621]